jgi:RNA polymerase sigma-70 factor (ECF subfamily)
VDPFEATKDAELRVRLREAVAELTPDHRAVILLRELEGLSYDEISQIMHCSKGTVMSRLHYARKKLQTLLKDFE